MSSRQKGKRNERNAAEIYQKAGYQTERATSGGFQSTDFFNLYDIIAARPKREGSPYLRFIQVKSNGANGIKSWMPEAGGLHQSNDIQPEYAIKYDYEGWRLDQPVLKDDGWQYRTVVDERNYSCNIGEKLTEYLKTGEFYE